MDEKRVAENILIIGLSTIASFIILIWLQWYDSRNFFEYANLLGYVLTSITSLLIGISIACSVRKKGLKAFLWSFGILAIIINLYNIINSSKAVDSWYAYAVIMSNVFAIVISGIIVLVINPLIRRFYLKEESKTLKENIFKKEDVLTFIILAMISLIIPLIISITAKKLPDYFRLIYYVISFYPSVFSVMFGKGYIAGLIFSFLIVVLSNRTQKTQFISVGIFLIILGIFFPRVGYTIRSMLFIIIEFIIIMGILYLTKIIKNRIKNKSK